jgi:DNA primase
MSLIGKPFLDELRSRLKLSDIIGQRITVQRAGREFKACCPFHNEKSPSFTINDEKEFFHCFGCGAHGDHLGFIMRHDNMPFMEAVETLAAQAGMQVPKPTPQDR